MSDDEKPRVSARAFPIWDLAVTLRPEGQSLGYLRDVSISGARLRTVQAVAVGARHLVRIELPPPPPEGERLPAGRPVPAAAHLDVQADVRWCRQVAPEAWEVGLEFTGALAPEDSALLGYLVFRASI